MKKLFVFALLLALSFSVEADPKNGYLVSNNTTEDALDNGETYTGHGVFAAEYGSAVVAVKTDQSGTLYMEQSPDGVNWDSSLSYSVSASTNEVHRLTVTRPYYRTRFTNDSGSNQTYFRLTTMLSNGSENLASPLNLTVQQDSDAQVVRTSDFRYEVAQGRWQNHSLWNKFGYNADIDTTTDPEILAAWGGTFQYITAGETLTIVSSSTADDGDPCGTGACTIFIWGVDENWAQQTETVTLNGTTNVVTTSQWIGVNRISVVSSGSGDVNAGNVTVTATSSGYTMAYMPAGEGTTQQCLFYVGANYTFLADWLWFSAIRDGSGGANPEITFKGWVYSGVVDGYFEVLRASMDTADTTHLEMSPSQPFVIGQKSILWFTAETDTNDTSVKCRFSGVEIKN